MKKQIDRTFVRSRETMNKYIEYIKDCAQMDNPPKPFADIDESSIKTFKYWLILPNRFPYDAIAEQSHMLLTRRRVAFDWTLLSNKELIELQELRETYINEHYDVMWENLPKGQTVPGHFHLHLLNLKRESL